MIINLISIRHGTISYGESMEEVEKCVKSHIMFNSDKALVGVEKQDGS